MAQWVRGRSQPRVSKLKISLILSYEWRRDSVVEVNPGVSKLKISLILSYEWRRDSEVEVNPGVSKLNKSLILSYEWRRLISNSKMDIDHTNNWSRFILQRWVDIFEYILFQIGYRSLESINIMSEFSEILRGGVDNYVYILFQNGYRSSK